MQFTATARLGRRLPAALLVTACALALAPGASAQNRREMQMMADIRMLQEQTQQLQVVLTALNKALEAVNARLDEQADATRKAYADSKLQVDQLGSDLRVVRERVDESNVRITSLSQEVEALRLTIPRLQAPPTPAIDPATGEPLPPAAVDPAAGVVPPAPSQPAPPGMSPQKMYDTAWADFTAGQWTLCIAGFEGYLRTFPRSELADEAQYHIGECYFADGKFDEAVDAYTRVVTGYPNGEAVSLAYYKRGLAHDRLGQADRARESFELVIKLFPDSDAARLAKQNLDRLNRGRSGA